MRSAAENRGLTLAQVTLFEEDIVDRVERSRASGIKGIAYTDPTFPANSSALPPSATGDHTRGYDVKWARPSEQFNGTESLLAHGDAALSEYVQGDCADNSFLSATALLATAVPGAPLLNGAPNAAEALLLTPDADVLNTGVLSAQFWRDGSWQGAVVDSRLPMSDLKAVREASPSDPMPDTHPESGELATPTCDAIALGAARGTPMAPALLRSRDAGEPWVPLLHKAYAALWAVPQPPHGALHPGTGADRDGTSTPATGSRDRAASRRRARARAATQTVAQLRAMVHTGYRALHCGAPGAPGLGKPWPALSWSTPSVSDVLADLSGCVTETWLLRGPHALRLLQMELDSRRSAEAAEVAARAEGGVVVDAGTEGDGAPAMRVTGIPTWAAWSSQRAGSLWSTLQASLSAGDRVMAVAGGPNGSLSEEDGGGQEDFALGAEGAVAQVIPTSPSAASLAMSTGPVSPARGLSGVSGVSGTDVQKSGGGARPDGNGPTGPGLGLGLGLGLRDRVASVPALGALDASQGVSPSVGGSGGDGASIAGSRARGSISGHGHGRAESRPLPPSGAGALGMEMEDGLRVDMESGLLRRHGYPIVYAREVRRGVRLVKLRDPWVLQSDVAGAGWSGDWSDDSDAWAEQPEVESALRKDPDAEFERGQRGYFWMAWEDTCRVFARLEVVRNRRKVPALIGTVRTPGTAEGKVSERNGTATVAIPAGPTEMVGSFSRQAVAGRQHRAVPLSEADASLFRAPGGALAGVSWRAFADASQLAQGHHHPMSAVAKGTARTTHAKGVKGNSGKRQSAKPKAPRPAAKLDRPPVRGKQRPISLVGEGAGGVSPVPEAWMHLDGDSQFFLHPQYRMVCPPLPPPGVAAPPSRAVTLTLSQEDVRARGARVGAALQALEAQSVFPGTSPGTASEVTSAWKDERWRRYLRAGITVLRRPRGARSIAFECGDQEVICTSEDAPFALDRDFEGDQTGEAARLSQLGIGAPRDCSLPQLHVDPTSSYILVVRHNEALPPVPQPRISNAASDAKDPHESLWWCPPSSPEYLLRADEEQDPTVQQRGSAVAAAAATESGADAISALASTIAKQSGAGRGDAKADGSRLPIRIQPLPAPTEVQIRGRWQVATATAAGAPVLPNGKSNPNWWMGPQWVAQFAMPLPSTARFGTSESKGQQSTGVQMHGTGLDSTFGVGTSSPRGGRGAAAGMTATLGATGMLRTPEALAARPGSRTTLKIVLRRNDRGLGRDDLPDGTKNRVGLVLTRALAVSAETDALRLRQAKRSQRRGGGGLPLAESSDVEVLVRRQAAAGGEGGQSPTVMGGTVVVSSSPCLFTRRWGLAKDAWVWSSSFHSAAEAVITVKVPSAWLDPAHGGGICIHPMLRLPGTEGSYSLRVYTSHDAPELLVNPVSEAAESSRKQRHVSAWVKGAEPTAGGSHLHSTWTHNPGFKLVPGPRVQALLNDIRRAQENRRAHEATRQAAIEAGEVPPGLDPEPSPDEEQQPIVRYSLIMRRPHEAWKRAITKDEAACMHGAYVVTVNAGRDSRECDGTDGLLMKAQFMPAQESEATLSVPWGSVARAEKDLCVLCATFDPGQQGPFSLEVVSDEDDGVSLAPYASAVIAEPESLT